MYPTSFILRLFCWCRYRTSRRYLQHNTQQHTNEKNRATVSRVRPFLSRNCFPKCRMYARHEESNGHSLPPIWMHVPSVHFLKKRKSGRIQRWEPPYMRDGTDSVWGYNLKIYQGIKEITSPQEMGLCYFLHIIFNLCQR